MNLYAGDFCGSDRKVWDRVTCVFWRTVRIDRKRCAKKRLFPGPSVAASPMMCFAIYSNDVRVPVVRPSVHYLRLWNLPSIKTHLPIAILASVRTRTVDRFLTSRPSGTTCAAGTIYILTIMSRSSCTPSSHRNTLVYT